MRLYTKHYSTFSFVGFMKLLLYFTAKYLEIRYLYLQEFNRLKLSFMTQKIHSFIFGIYPNHFSYLQYFPAWKSLKSIWSLYNIDSTNFKNVFIIIVFNLFVENFKVGGDILGCIYHGITDSVIMVLPWFSR